MKHLRFIRAAFAVLLVFVFTSGCYTTFYGVRQNDTYEGEGNPSNYADDNDYYDYSDNYPYEDASIELAFHPSRFVVEKNYYSYGQHVRKVKYMIYEYDPWYVPYDYVYYSGPQVNVYFSIGFHSYYDFGIWYSYNYYPQRYVSWLPPYGWNDSWCGWPVYYPVYYPIYVPVYYPGPVYYPYPYDYTYNHIYYENYKKRDWDRRQPVDNSRIARRGSERPGNSTKSDLPDSRISTRPQRDSQRESTVNKGSNPGNERSISRRTPEANTSLNGKAPTRVIKRDSQINTSNRSGNTTSSRPQVQTGGSTGSRSVSNANLPKSTGSRVINRPTENNIRKEKQGSSAINRITIPSKTREPAPSVDRSTVSSRPSSSTRTYSPPAIPVQRPVNTSNSGNSSGKNNKRENVTRNSSRTQAPRQTNISRQEPARSYSAPSKPAQKPGYAPQPASSASKNVRKSTASASKGSKSNDSDKNKKSSSGSSNRKRR